MSVLQDLKTDPTIQENLQVFNTELDKIRSDETKEQKAVALYTAHCTLQQNESLITNQSNSVGHCAISSRIKSISVLHSLSAGRTRG
jgi:hypothetical protein